MRFKTASLSALFFLACVVAGCSHLNTVQDGNKTLHSDPAVQAFLDQYTTSYVSLGTASNEASWIASTDVSEAHTQAKIAAAQRYSEFSGSTEVLSTLRTFLKKKNDLPELQARQIQAAYLEASEAPGTIPEVVKALITAGARQSAALDGFAFKMKQVDGSEKAVTPNDIDDLLRDSTDLSERLRTWESAKSIGPSLREGLVNLRGLRNQVAKEMGYDGYFSLQVADYGMTTPEMMAMLDRFLAELQPLYSQLQCYARRQLAARYGQPEPREIPAHWLSNRWGQEWSGLVEGVDLDLYFKSWSKEQIVSGAESFYTSMGFPKLPETFWTKSDLYDLPADSPRKKNTHASAWHIDMNQDVRSLMSVRPDFEWFLTAHHELGHIYYYISYSRPEVPPLLRRGANRAFHEGIGELISLAASHASYLRDAGVLPATEQIDEVEWLLNDAMKSVVFMPWSVGVMSHFERDLYDGNLPADQFNARWWQYVEQFQGIAPPSPRGEEFCDAATKTHINDDPAGYYDYALATVLKFQINDYIAKHILHCSPRETNYRNNKEVGDFLHGILAKGGTEDWRTVLKEATGEDLSARAMLEYYAPLTDWLKKENAGAQVGW